MRFLLSEGLCGVVMPKKATRLINPDAGALHYIAPPDSFFPDMFRELFRRAACDY